MKANIFFAAIAALAVTSCAIKTEQPETLDEQMTIHASMAEQPADVKSCVQDGGTQVYWEASDEIKVFFKSSSGRFVSQNTALAAAADFQGSLNMLVGANEGAGTTNALWGLYPYRADAEYDGSSVTTTLPAEQTGRAGSFAKNTHITLACSYSHDLAFYNVCSGLRFSLTQEGIKSVTFEGNGGEALAGRIKMAFADGTPAISEVTEPQTVITLTAPAGGTFETGKWYYIEALPGTLSKGFKMVFNKDGESATLTSKSSVTLRRGKFGSLADADDGLIFKPTGGDTPDPSAIIQFTDPIAKYACVEKYDTNGDGEISYGEAAAVTSLSGLFKDWNTVESFDEIKYFTSITSTEGVFTGLMNLKSITIPDNITSLGTFQGCTSLKTVVLPSTLGKLPSSCFSGCTALTDVTLPLNITTISVQCFQNCSTLETLSLAQNITMLAGRAFEGCSSLVGLELPPMLNYIGLSAFENCTSLATLEFPSSLISIAARAFSGCRSLTSVSLGTGVEIGVQAFQSCTSLSSIILPSDLKVIPESCFSNCESLYAITWPEYLMSIGGNAFSNCPFKDNNYTLELPGSVTSVESHAFAGVNHLIFPSLSAVSIAKDAFSTNNTFIYVPIGMIETYKVKENWWNYVDRIHPIEDYPVSLVTGGAVGEPVDLGLSVKWASWNVGSSMPVEYGSYFAWGETEPKWEYSWSTYKWCEGGDRNLTKYCHIDRTNYWNGAGLPDGITLLNSEDDAAHANWGGCWRMPTDAEWTELLENCTCTWTDNYNGTGIAGSIVTSNQLGYEGKSIFLPAAGCWGGTSLYVGPTTGNCYWSSSLEKGRPSAAMLFSFYSGGVKVDNKSRRLGCSIRPVTDGTSSSIDYIPVSSITLSDTSIIINSGDFFSLTATVLPSNATNKTVEWSSSDISVASVNQNGRVHAVGTGVATIAATTLDGRIYATCSVTVNDSIVVSEYVDLGLSVKWATCNVGATNPQDYGAYFSWGETEPKSYYYWPGYKWCKGAGDKLTKYCPLDKTEYWGGSGSPDNKNTLDLEDDTAYVVWGGCWRMPTDAEWTELLENCTCTWTDNYNGTGIAGQIITSKKTGYEDRAIFLPSSGYKISMTLYGIGTQGSYWSSSLYAKSPKLAWTCCFVSDRIIMTCDRKDEGMPVRPVYDDRNQ